MATMSIYVSYLAGISECETNGLDGNCGVDCSVFQRGWCKNDDVLALQECEEALHSGNCGESCPVFQRGKCEEDEAVEFSEPLSWQKWGF